MHKQLMTLCAIATLVCGVTFAEESTQAEIKKTTEEEGTPLASCPCGKKKKTEQQFACGVCGDPHHKRHAFVATEATDEQKPVEGTAVVAPEAQEETV